MKHVDWDAPGRASVMAHYANDPKNKAAVSPGSVLSARYRGMVVRVTLDMHEDDTSYGRVAAIINPKGGERVEHYEDLKVGDQVRLPDNKRAFEEVEYKED